MSKYHVYLVGGAVRDKLLGLSVKDKDWVVTGATPEMLETQGYQQVGKQFPVFLHPRSKEEYALARKEKKQGQGYTGFICDFSPDITLEEDLERRDLTINAIAQDNAGHLIDPFDGQKDLDQRILKHVSSAFVEDPLRVLRVARFAARFHDFGFKVAPETLALMKDISHSGELNTLSAERIWKELEKALSTQHAHVFFDALEQADALETLFPEFIWRLSDELKKQLSNARLSAPQRWALLCQFTPSDDLATLHTRLKCPNQYKTLAEQVRSFQEKQTIPIPPDSLENWLTAVSAIKKPHPYQLLVEVIATITKTEIEDWQSLRESIAKLTAAKLIKQGFSGAELGQALKASRVDTLSKLENPLVKRN